MWLILGICACLAWDFYLPRPEMTCRRLTESPAEAMEKANITEMLVGKSSSFGAAQLGNQTEAANLTEPFQGKDSNFRGAGFPPENLTDTLPTLQFEAVIWAGNGRVRGIESCYGANIGYCNALMYRAHGACASSGCVQIVNPPGHRTRTPLHIHSYHYNGRGAGLKRHMSKMVCRSPGWHGGGLPCGGKARYFPGYPPVFSVARGAGSISHASVTAWPGSCGGGTIVLVSFGCSIEHAYSHR